MVILVNKNHIFNEKDIENYEMIEYENHLEEIHYVENDTFRHFEMLRAHMRIEGIDLDISSGYRSLEKQENIFIEYMKKYGVDYAEEIVAMPGTSEHHTGLAIDLAVNLGDGWIIENDDLLKCSDVFEKIHKVLKYFGFILRYPKDKESITGYSYEPWHIRYVGDKVAMEIGDRTLEEYLEGDSLDGAHNKK